MAYSGAEYAMTVRDGLVQSRGGSPGDFYKRFLLIVLIRTLRASNSRGCHCRDTDTIFSGLDPTSVVIANLRGCRRAEGAVSVL